MDLGLKLSVVSCAIKPLKVTCNIKPHLNGCMGYLKIEGPLYMVTQYYFSHMSSSYWQ